MDRKSQVTDTQENNFELLDRIQLKNIAKVMDALNFKNPTQMAKAIGVSQGYMSDILNEKKRVPKTLGGKLEDKLGIRRLWFLTGIGEMFLKGHTKQEQNANEKNFKNYLNEPSTEYRVSDVKDGVPVYYSDLSSGLFDNKNLMPVGWLNVPEFSGCDAIIRVKDDSMADKMNEKDWIGIKKINEWDKFLPLGYIYAISTGDVELVRTIKRGSKEGHFKLVSSNKAYEDDEIPKNIIKEVWSVKTILPYSKIETLL